MRLRIYRNTSTDISDTVRVQGTNIVRDWGGRTGVMEFSIIVASSAAVPVAFWDEITAYELTEESTAESEPLFGTVFYDDVMFGGAGTTTYTDGDKVFGGYVTSITRRPFRKGSNPYVEYRVTAQDYNILLDQTVVSSASYSATADNTAIAAQFATLLPAVDTSGVSFVSNITLEIANMTLRNMLERMSETSQAHFHITPAKVLKYHSPSSEAAAYSLSEAPDNVSSFPFHLGSFEYQEDFSTPCNKCTVVGELNNNTTAFSQTYQDATSQATYGVRERHIVDRRVASATEALARATAEVQQYAYPRVEGSITFWQDGIEVGTLLTIYAPTFGCDGDYRVTRLTMTWESSKTRTTYRAEFGVFRPDLVRTLRLLAEMAQDKGNTPVAVPSDSSVGNSALDRTTNPIVITGTDIGTGTITGSNIANATITGTNIAAATITGSNIAAATITGSNIDDATITADNIALATITGDRIALATITGSRIDDATITADNIAAATITGDRIAAATITGSNIAAATITGDRIASATITGSNIQDATISGDKLSSATITGDKIASATITAANIQDGTITADEIANATITGSKIATGTITADNIQDGSITANEIQSAAITGDKIASATITATNIQDGTITGSKIGSLTITGDNIAIGGIVGGNIQNASISGDKLVNLTVTADKIANATITADKIASLAITATHIQNLTITASKIASLTISGDKIADGAITSVKINSLEVAKITGWSGASILVGTGFLMTGTGGITLAGGGGLSVLAGGVFAIYGTFKSGGLGWDIWGGGSSYIALNGNIVINNSAAFVGYGGVACTTSGIGGTGHNTYSGGAWYNGATGNFVSADGKAVFVIGGTIWAIF